MDPQPSKNIIQTFIGAAFLLILVGIGAYYLRSAGSPKVCTQEAKQCPDGSFVGRVGSNCEFQSCPSGPPVTATTPEENNNDTSGLKVCTDCPILTPPPVNWCKGRKVVAGKNTIFREKNCYCPVLPICVD